MPAVLVAALLAGGCTSFAEGEGESSSAEVATSRPDERLTVVADADPVASSVSASRALFDRAGVAVLARDGDRAGTLLGASAAVGLGVPLLIQPADGAVADGPVAGELDRLGARTVLSVGNAAGGAGGKGKNKDTGEDEAEAPDVVAVPADPAAVEAATGLDLDDGKPVPADGDAAAVARLDPDAPAALRPEDEGKAAGRSSSSRDGEGPAELPEIERAKPLGGTLVLASGGPEDVAGIATARAAGARVELTGGAADPRASGDAVTALSEDEPEAVVAMGAGFADQDGLDWKLRTAREGAQLPGGGQLLFPQHMLVALYGTPGTGALGVLGEQDLPATVERARKVAAPYEPLVDTTVVPAFEIIATVASSSAGPDGNYSSEAEVDALRPWVERAGEEGIYVVLDLQPGRTDFLTQAKQYSSLLELPHVGLALDPEWRLGPNEVHLTQIGSVGIDEVNSVVTWLADLTREKALPQKLLVLHQFQLRMIKDRERLDTSRDELAIMVHADGQGAQGAKQDTWRVLHQNAPAPLFWGWKNFYDEDQPMLTPEQTIAQVEPRPELVTYQ